MKVTYSDRRGPVYVGTIPAGNYFISKDGGIYLRISPNPGDEAFNTITKGGVLAVSLSRGFKTYMSVNEMVEPCHIEEVIVKTNF